MQRHIDANEQRRKAGSTNPPKTRIQKSQKETVRGFFSELSRQASSD